MTQHLYLFATIAGTPIAIPASEIEAVVRLGDIVPIQRVPPHVRGLAALRSRVLTVVDMQAKIFGERMALEKAPLAVVCEIGGHGYGMLIESVTDICEAPSGLQPLQGRIARAWNSFATALAEREGRSHLVLTLHDFVTAPAATLAA